MHLADLVKWWLREALLAAQRCPVVHRATNQARYFVAFASVQTFKNKAARAFTEKFIY